MNHEYKIDAASAETHDTEFSLLDVMIALAKHKKLIAGLPVAAACIAAAISLVLPNTYSASTKLLPPQQAQSGASALLAQLGGVASMAAGVAGLKNPNDLYVGMLKSRTVTDRLIAQYDLKKAYATPSQESARKTLEGSTVITSGKDGLITIQVEDKDPKRVARMANSYVEELHRLTGTLALTEASQRRVFYEGQLEQSKDNLAKAEVALKQALDTHGVISVDSESAAIVANIGRLKAQVSAKEIELNGMRPFVTENNPSYRRVEEELNSLRAELNKLESGGEGNGKAGVTDGRRGGFENIKLLRDVKYYQMLYELLAKQYEVARLDEAREPSIIQVLDPAVEPERKSGPQRTLIVLATAFISLVVAVLWSLLAEIRLRAQRSPARAARWNELKAYLRFR